MEDKRRWPKNEAYSGSLPILLAQKKCAGNANQVLGAQGIKASLLERPGSPNWTM
jgi:hypothetical protein